MGIVSYAQNFEDVMLWRALKNVDNGFYIDVGAAWPDEDSVTKAFYDHGWTGINIEPNPSFISQYTSNRSKDINLQVAVSDKSGVAELHFIDGTGLSSLDENIAKSHADLGFETTPSEVTLTTLENICKEHAQERDIHFLKVDVEGLEKYVLIGNDWTKYRPWIVLVEATLPMSQKENYVDWEYILVESGYTFVYADGLNRFYISKEHNELLSSFKYPPNVFDEFDLSTRVHAETKASEAEAKANEAEAKANEAEAKASEAEAKATEAEIRANDTLHHYHSVINSNSWKIMKPFRLAGKALRWFVTGAKHWITFSPTSRPRRVLKQTLLSLKHRINANPKLKMKLMSILSHFPGLKARLKSIEQVDYHAQTTITQIDGPAQLSPRAKKIYNDLKKEIALQKGDK